MLAPWKKSYDQTRQCIEKQRHYFANQGPSSQSYGFSSSHVWLWESDYKESWAPMNCCCWIVVWSRFLRVPWNVRRYKQSIVKEISPEYSLEGLMLKLKLQYFGHWFKEPTHWKRPCCWERLKAGGEGKGRGWHAWMASVMQWTCVSVGSGSWWWTGSLVCCTLWGLKESYMTEWLNWLYLAWENVGEQNLPL